MSRKRSDPALAKARKERIRALKHAQRNAPPPGMPRHPYAAESALRQIHAVLEGQEFKSVEELNARLDELNSSGQLAELAATRARDDPKYQAQELAYEAMGASDAPTALNLVNRALKLDPACIDANRLMAELLPIELENRVQLLRQVIRLAEMELGEEFFTENTGNFWGILETRPYMRTLLTLAQMLRDLEQQNESVQIFERMLELNPDDNQGVRYNLMALYLALRRLDAVARLLERYPGEEEHTAVFVWGRVMERYLSGAAEEAGAALARAREQNPFVEQYLTGRKQMPQYLPPIYSPGADSEAQVAAAELVPALESAPRFVAWLKERK